MLKLSVTFTVSLAIALSFAISSFCAGGEVSASGVKSGVASGATSSAITSAQKRLLERFPIEVCFAQATTLSLDPAERAAAKRACILHGAGALPFLRSTLAGKESLKRQVALELLGRMGEDRDELPLLKALADADPIVAENARSALRFFYASRTPGFIRRRVEDSANPAAAKEYPSEVRCRAVEALLYARATLAENLSEAEENAVLFFLADDKAQGADAALKAPALSALARGGERTREALRQHLDSADEQLAIAAAESLQVRGDKDLIAACERLSASENSLVRLRALALARDLKNPLAEEFLAHLLDDPSWRIRALACEALGGLGLKAVTPGLDRLLNDASAYVRSSCAIALQRQGALGLDWRLLEDLKNEQPLFRAEAARALGVMRAEKARDGLLQMLSDQSVIAAEAAAKALALLPAPDAKTKSALAQAAEDPRLPVALAATEALAALEK